MREVINIQNFPEDYEFGWRAGIGFDAPWDITSDIILNKKFFNTFALAAIEKMSAGGGTSGAYFQFTNIANDYMNDEQVSFYGHVDGYSYLRSIADLYINLWNNGRWLKHELYSQDTIDQYWQEIADESVYTDDDLKAFLGDDIYNKILGDNRPLNVNEYWDWTIWWGLGVMWWFMKYSVSDVYSYYGGYLSTSYDYQTGENRGVFETFRNSFGDTSGWLVNGVYIAENDFSYDTTYTDPDSGEESPITYDFKENFIYKRVDNSEVPKRAGRKQSLSWQEIEPAEGDYIKSGYSIYSYDGESWQSRTGTLQQGGSPIDVIRFNAGSKYSYYQIVGETDYRDGEENYGPQSVRELQQQYADRSIAEGVYSENSSRAFVKMSFIARVSKSYRDGELETENYRVSMSNGQTEFWKGGGVSITALDITGNPIKSDALYGTAIVLNVIVDNYYSVAGGKESPFYDKFPIVNSSSIPVKWDFGLITTLEDDGVTTIVPDFSFIDGDPEGEGFPYQTIMDIEFPTMPGGNETANDSRFYGFQMSISPVLPDSHTAGYSLRAIRQNPALANYNSPLFISMNLPDAKYYISDESMPQPYDEDDEGGL